MIFFSRQQQEDEEDLKNVTYLAGATKTKDCDMADSDIASVCSICETNRESVASDLTRMCVSDEEDRPLEQTLAVTT